MTKQEFEEQLWQEIYNEMRFLYPYSEVEPNGKAWYTTDLFIEHGKKFKKQLLNHIYAKRGFYFIDFQYK